MRYYGAYANRARKLYRAEDEGVVVRVIDPEPVSAGQASWARLLRQVFEVDHLACPRCGTELVIVSVITAPAVIDAILGYMRKTGKDDLWGQEPLPRHRSRRTLAIRGSAEPGRGGDDVFREGGTGALIGHSSLLPGGSSGSVSGGRGFVGPGSRESRPRAAGRDCGADWLRYNRLVVDPAFLAVLSAARAIGDGERGRWSGMFRRTLYVSEEWVGAQVGPGDGFLTTPRLEGDDLVATWSGSGEESRVSLSTIFDEVPARVVRVLDVFPVQSRDCVGLRIQVAEEPDWEVGLVLTTGFATEPP